MINDILLAFLTWTYIYELHTNTTLILSNHIQKRHFVPYSNFSSKVLVMRFIEVGAGIQFLAIIRSEKPFFLFVDLFPISIRQCQAFRNS